MTVQEIVDKLTPEIIEDMKSIHFIGDLHHKHNKIIDICNRPTTVEEHTDWLINDVYNKYIKKKDIVYLLGDVSFASKIEAEKFIDKLNGEKFLILGNHDQNIKNSTRFKQIKLIKNINYSKFGLNIHIVLCHYPMFDWNRKYHGSWMIHGHTHGNVDYMDNIKNLGMVYDVGIDNKEFPELSYRPINLYDIVNIMLKRELKINKK